MITTEAIAAQPAQNARPEWVRMPKAGKTCPWTGLTRSYLYALSAEGKIKTVSLRERGKTRGVRLIHLDSILAYIAKQAEGQSAA